MLNRISDDATDKELLELFVEGRAERAFTLLLNRHAKMVVATVGRVLRSFASKEDAFQATFLALAKAAGKLGPKTSVPAWLHRTATRCALMTLRRENRQSEKVKRMTDHRAWLWRAPKQA